MWCDMDDEAYINPCRVLASPPGVWKTYGNVDGSVKYHCALHERTTLVLRGIPLQYTVDMVCALLDQKGFAGKYDFVYLPTNFTSSTAYGYGFVNLVSHQLATQVMEELEGFHSWSVQNDNVCNVVWSSPYQGLNDCVERYRNSPVMSPSVPECFKPLLLEHGQRVPFPAPTKRVKEPRLRKKSVKTLV